MANKNLHIVSLDVPFPADYGGVIDIFYRIKALHSLGYNITLHCYEYGRGTQPELEKYTAEIHYYKREKKLKDLFGRTPFIVKTRSSEQLLNNLLLDKDPILFEGLHTTFFLGDERLKDRVKIVRTHNVEHVYYDGLAQKSIALKKYFFKREAGKLKEFEHVLKHANHILTIQEKDHAYFSKMHTSVHLFPASIPPLEEMTTVETEPYSLFHGNLSVIENENAALWLIEALSINGDSPFVIAGKNPTEKLITACAEQNVELIANPDFIEMGEILNNARVHVLYTDQPTGLKLKLLNALQTSGHVIVNDEMIEGTYIGALCDVANTPAEFREQIQLRLQTNLTKEEFSTRKLFLDANYNTVKNCALFSMLLGD